MLNRDSILTASDTEIVKVEVPQWGGHIFVKTMSGIDRDSYESQAIAARDGQTDALRNIRARIAVRTVCDEAGNLMFKPEDAEELGKKSGAALDIVFTAAQRLGKISDKDIDDLVGKS